MDQWLELIAKHNSENHKATQIKLIEIKYEMELASINFKAFWFTTSLFLTAIIIILLSK
jgi:hypothetical protein